MKSLIPLFLFSSLCYSLSVEPPLPSGAFTNSVNFDFANSRFDFFCTAGSTTLRYRVNAAAGPMLSSLSATVDGSYTFTPSNGGGAGMVSGTTEIYPWSGGVSYRFISADSLRDTLRLSWIMRYAADSIHVRYGLLMRGRTLTLRICTDEARSPSFYLDRCEHAAHPAIVPIPYLTLCNVLFSGTVFTSMFFDWENTDASCLYAVDGVFSDSSVYYAQNAYYYQNSAGQLRPVNETVYLTVSPELSDVLPGVPNPVSPYRDQSASRIFIDLWTGQFSEAANAVHRCRAAGLRDAWVEVHTWQRAGYDVQYPDVLPANPSLGGTTALLAVRDSAVNAGYLFGLHENYVDMYADAPSYSTTALAKNSDGTFKKAWFNPGTLQQSYQIKPSLAAHYMDIWAPQIHSTFTTSASFLDVHSAVNPGDKNDYDAAVTGSGMFRETLRLYRSLGAIMRAYHQGPVSGEGAAHFLDGGYFDDFEAQINSGRSWGWWQGSRMPVMPDFKLTRMHASTVCHGVGYYERFYSDTTGTQIGRNWSRDSVLEYIATELAYGNAGFVPSVYAAPRWDSIVQLETRHVLPAQKLYCMDSVVSIRYDDNGSLVSASEFIRRHPTTFSDCRSADFMSKVQVQYARGTVVWVNRNPLLSWIITAGSPGEWFDFHASAGNRDTLGAGTGTPPATWTLPRRNGWLVCAPARLVSCRRPDSRRAPLTEFLVRRNRAGQSIKISFVNTTFPGGREAAIDVFDCSGRRMASCKAALTQLSAGVVLGTRARGAGMLFIRVRSGGNTLLKRLAILQ